MPPKKLPQVIYCFPDGSVKMQGSIAFGFAEAPASLRITIPLSSQGPVRLPDTAMPITDRLDPKVDAL